jgi:Na+-translocating ferredoxin:NAD+ oxidoreductase RnfG subunit
MKKAIPLIIVLILLILLALAAIAVNAQEVNLSPAQARREIFPEMARTVDVRRVLSDSMRAELARRLGRPVDDDTLVITEVFDSAGALRGYTVVTEEIGKYRPITFMVGVTPAIVVREVEVLVYRETRGGDVKRQRFLRQYRGKTAHDPIDLDHDIINVSGATISVRSMNAGVKRVLAELALLYPLALGSR